MPLPALATDADGTLRSTQFGDVYFSREGGSAETEHVFLRGNRLPERWRTKKSFTIGEIGFGSGLNFLVTWKKFLETAPESHHLHCVSFEQYPLTREMMEMAQRHCEQSDPERSGERRAQASQPIQLLQHRKVDCFGAKAPRNDTLPVKLLRYYPLRLPGLHRIHFDRVTLTLAFGDARALLPQINHGEIDAWFLDGFSPAKNPELWGDDIIREVARLSAPDATFATYTVASAVRRGLEAHGFTLEKQKGFGKKREMLVGHRMGTLRSRDGRGEPEAAGRTRGSGSGGVFAPRAHARQTIILGAGIAGCAMARTLADRGMKVTLLERNTVACGASGNLAAALYPQLTKNWRAATAWHFSAYGFTLRQLRRWKDKGLDFSFASPGMAKVPASAEEEARLRCINNALGIDASIATWLEADALSEKLGMEIKIGGVWFPQGSWINPAALCHALVQHPLITLHERTDIAALTRSAEGWQVATANGKTFSAAAVVLCNAQSAAAFVPELIMGTSAGQVSIFSAAHTKRPMRAIFCHKGYMIPQGDTYLIGATYDHQDFSCAVTEENHRRNLDELEKALPGWLPPLSSSPQAGGTMGGILGGRTSLRATTPERLPYVGNAGDGLYVSTGFGSRGMISAPLAAEIIASEIVGEVVPLTAELRAAVSPLRHCEGFSPKQSTLNLSSLRKQGSTF